MTTPITGMYGTLPTQGSGPNGTGTSNIGAPGTGTVSQTGFLNMLVAELQNQNPLNPMSSSSFITQMATLTEVSAMGQMTSAMTDLLNVQASNSAVNLLGKSVTLSNGSGTVNGTVTGVEAGPSGPQVVVGGATYSLSNVLSVGSAPAAGTASGTAGGTGAATTGGTTP